MASYTSAVVFALILVVKLKRIVGDLRVHCGTGENWVVINEILLWLKDEKDEAIMILRGEMYFLLVFNTGDGWWRFTMSVMDFRRNILHICLLYEFQRTIHHYVALNFTRQFSISNNIGCHFKQCTDRIIFMNCPELLLLLNLLRKISYFLILLSNDDMTSVKRLTSVRRLTSVCLSVAHSVPKSRTQTPEIVTPQITFSSACTVVPVLAVDECIL